MKIIALLVSVFFLSACATGGKNKRSTKVYKSNYKLSEFKKIKAKKCPSISKAKQLTELDDLMSSANSCVKSNDWSKVKFLGKRMLEKHSEAPWGAYYLALHAKTTGENQRALWMLDLGLKKSPNLSLFIYEKGRVLWGMKDYQQAVILIERAVDIDDSLTEAYLFLGQVYLRDGNIKKSDLYFKRVLYLDSDNLSAYKGLAETSLKLKKYELSTKYLNEVIDEESGNLIARLKLAQVYEKNLENLGDALSTYKRVKRKFSKANIEKVLGSNIDTKLKQLSQLIAQKRAAERKVSSIKKNKGAN